MNFLLANLLIMLLTGLGLLSCQPLLEQGDENPTSAVITVVPKQDHTPFYARFATSADRILVTAPRHSKLGIPVQIKQGKSLHYAELMNANAPKISGEIFRQDRLAIFEAKSEEEAHESATAVDQFAHTRQIDLKNLHTPSSNQTFKNLNNHTGNSLITSGIEIDSARMRADLEALSGAKPIFLEGQEFLLSNRATSENKTKARRWLTKSFEDLGYKVSEHRYGSGTNLIAEKAHNNVKDRQIFMVTAHLDSVQTAGADDDASGVISALSIARALSAKTLDHTLRFVAFDEEERGLLGSAAYAKHLASIGEIQRVSVLNLEMTGYDSDNNGEFHTIDCNENESGSLSEVLMATIGSEQIALSKVQACTNRSDHAVFWNYDRPAIVISQNFFGGDGNPCYHRSCDTVAKINFEYMEKITQAVANTVYRLIANTSE